jgi:hypothetical protein
MTIDDLKAKAAATRFVRGTGLLGPEFAGCCGTGMRPLILRNPYREVQQVLFFVGPELEVERFKFQIARDEIAHKRQFKYGDTDKRCVFVYKTKNNAIAKWVELCMAVLKFNAEERKEVASLRAKAAQGDMSAVLSLGLDH